MDCEIERACTALVTRYTHLVDLGRPADVPMLFTENGSLDTPDGILIGRAALRAKFEARQADTRIRSRHICTNLLITALGPDHATGESYVTQYRVLTEGDVGNVLRYAGPVTIGNYQDRFRRVGNEWLIQERRYRPTFTIDVP